MPRRSHWVGRDLHNLLTLPIAELVRLYPQWTEGTLKGKKAYHKKKHQGMTMEQLPENPTVNQATEEVVDGNLVSQIDGWYEVVTKDAEGVAHTHRLYKHSTKVRPLGQEAVEQFEPATPARITPSRRKPVERAYRSLFVFSDAQIDYRRMEDGSLEPIHDERAIKVAQMLCKELQPDEIINLGDTVDLAAMSRFKPDSNHFQRTIGPSFQRVHDMYAQFRSDNPHAKITEVDSNHNTRLKDFFLKNAPDLYNMRRPGAPESEYPMFTYPYMANLGHVGVDWVSGYGAAEYLYGADYDKPPIVFKHGHSSVSGGSTAARESGVNPETHVVRGHGHRIEMHNRTNRSGEYLTSIMVGILCRTDGAVPGVWSAVDDRGQIVPKQQNWQNGVLLIRDYQGDYEFVNIPIRDGIALYNGKIYNGDD